MISAAKHWCKDEGFFEKTFILEIMFEYYFIEKYTICQGPDRKSRLILTVTELRRNFRRSQKPIVRDFEKIVSPQSEGLRYPEHLCSPGLGAGAPTSTKPPISAAAEMGGFCILCIQMHCLHRNNFTNYITNLLKKETQIMSLSIRNKVSCALLVVLV